MRALASRSWLVGVLAVVLPISSARSQDPVPVDAVVTAFLADSGVGTRGLSWDTGRELPVEWQSDQPVPAEAWLQKQGYTLSRTGTVRVAVGDTLMRDATLDLQGNDAGIQRVALTFDEIDNWLTIPLESALGAGLTLTPLKCSRETEPPSYGNVVWVAKAPAKAASGLWMGWNCGQECGVTLTILYRKAEVAAIECVGSG